MITLQSKIRYFVYEYLTFSYKLYLCAWAMHCCSLLLMILRLVTSILKCCGRKIILPPSTLFLFLYLIVRCIVKFFLSAGNLCWILTSDFLHNSLNYSCHMFRSKHYTQKGTKGEKWSSKIELME